MSNEGEGPEYWKRRTQRIKTKDLPFYKRNFVHLAYAAMIAIFTYTYYLPYKMMLLPPTDLVVKQLDPRMGFVDDPSKLLKRREALDRILLEDFKKTILNRNIIESRPFDFMYDPDYSIPTKKNYNELAKDAIEKTSEQEIRPIYGSMFSSIDRFPKTEFVFKTELVQISWEEKKQYEEEEGKKFRYKKNCLSGQDLIKYVYKSNVDIPIKIRLENFNKSSSHKICINSIGNNEIKSMTQLEEVMQSAKRKSKSNKSTQTDYRDSETQTDPWVPLYDDRLSSILFLKSSEQDPLVEYEIDTADEKRKICELEKILSAVDKRNLKTQIAITKKIERIKWLIKEKKIDYINSTRMELAEKLLYRKSIETRINITQREEYYKKIQTEIKNHKLNALTKNMERELRKLNHYYTNCTKNSTVMLTTEKSNFHVHRNHDIYYNSY